MANHLRPEAFIFDLDGTLVDSGLDIALSANHVRGHYGLPPLAVPVLVSYVGDGVRTLLQRTLGHDVSSGRTGAEGLPVAEARLVEALGVFAAHYREHLLDHTRLYPDVPEVLDRLSAVPLLMATNKPREFTDAVLDGLGLAGRFARIMAGDEVPRRKPDPAHLAACLPEPAPASSSVVMVGDSPNDVLAARAFGAVSVGCTFGLVAPERVRATNPDHVIDSFGELGRLFG